MNNLGAKMTAAGAGITEAAEIGSGRRAGCSYMPHLFIVGEYISNTGCIHHTEGVFLVWLHKGDSAGHGHRSSLGWNRRPALHTGSAGG